MSKTSGRGQKGSVSNRQLNKREIDINKLRPKEVDYEREQLKMEIEHLMNDMYRQREENKELREKLGEVEREKDNYETIIGQVEEYIINRKVRDSMKKESNKVIGFKR